MFTFFAIISGVQNECFHEYYLNEINSKSEKGCIIFLCESKYEEQIVDRLNWNGIFLSLCERYCKFLEYRMYLHLICFN